jgi:hypothetical protein
VALFPHVTEKLIQAAQERGEFDGLPGAGKPIPDLDQPYDECWWVRKWLEREDLNPARELREEGGKPAFAALLDAALDRRDARRRRR